MFFFPLVHRLEQTASSSWFLKTSRTKCRVTRRGRAPRWRRSAAWRWDSGTKVWRLLWPLSAWLRPPSWASMVRWPCWRGRPACDTASEKVSRTRPAGAFSRCFNVWSCVNNTKSDLDVMSEQVPAAKWIHPSCCVFPEHFWWKTAAQKNLSLWVLIIFWLERGLFEVGSRFMKTCQGMRRIRRAANEVTSAAAAPALIYSVMCTSRAELKQRHE